MIISKMFTNMFKNIANWSTFLKDFMLQSDINQTAKMTRLFSIVSGIFGNRYFEVYMFDNSWNLGNY